MTKKVVDAGSLKTGGYVIIDDIPCRVTNIQTSKTGKHGHAKCRIEAVGLVDGTKKIIVKPSHDKLEVPIIEKKSAQVLSVQGNIANVMDNETYETFDIEIQEDLQGKVKENSQIIYWIMLGKKILRQLK